MRCGFLKAIRRAALFDDRVFVVVRERAWWIWVLVCAAVLLPGAAAAQTPEQIVGRQRASYGATVSPADAPTLLRAIAVDLTQTLGTPYGLLPKAAGNQCGGYACDIICNAQFHWDVLHDGPDATVNYAGVATPQWNASGPVPRACELVAPSAPLPSPPTPAPGPVPAPAPTIDLSALLAKLDALTARLGAPPSDSVYAQNERTYADLTKQHNDQTATIVATVNEPAFVTKIFSNRYVQLALAGLGTYLMTAQVKR